MGLPSLPAAPSLPLASKRTAAPKVIPERPLSQIMPPPPQANGKRWGNRGISTTAINIWLVVSKPLKNMKVSWDYSSQYKEKIKAMFQTPNQTSINIRELESGEVPGHQ
jgi:hypothetical protein